MEQADEVTVGELPAAVEDLRRRLEVLESGIFDEIQARRVSVVDEAGVQRVVLSAANRSGSVLVRIDRAAGRTTGAELFAWEDPDGNRPDAGVALVRCGDVATQWPDPAGGPPSDGPHLTDFPASQPVGGHTYDVAGVRADPGEGAGWQPE